MTTIARYTSRVEVYNQSESMLEEVTEGIDIGKVIVHPTPVGGLKWQAMTKQSDDNHDVGWDWLRAH